jgi:hypothetical protein
VNRGNRSSALEGFQSQARSFSAPIRIDYQSLRFEHFLKPLGEDWLLCFSKMKGQWNSGQIRETTNLDPYAIRNAFEAVETPEEAARFLSEGGLFWPFESVRWTQFREWQDFFSFLRMEPEQARGMPMGLKALETARGFQNSFFAQTDAEFSRSRFPADVIEEIGGDRWTEIEMEDRRTLRELRRFALHPVADGERGRVSVSWYDPNDSHAPEDWKARRKRKSKRTMFEPFLRIETLNIVEAIAATIFADQINGTRVRKCKHCGRLFQVESDHGQEFCPAPLHLKSSPCKNAYLQKMRRNRQKEAIELLLKGWSKGHSTREIEREASANGLSLTAEIRQQAKKRINRGVNSEKHSMEDQR